MRASKQSKKPSQQDDIRKKVASGGKSSSRRAFLGQLSGVAAASLAATTVGFGSVASADERPRDREFGGHSEAGERASQSYDLRVEVAGAERKIPIPFHQSNSDEQLYKNRIGNYSKALPHNTIGEVEPYAYNALLHACDTGNPGRLECRSLGRKYETDRSPSRPGFRYGRDRLASTATCAGASRGKRPTSRRNGRRLLDGTPTRHSLHVL